MGCLVVVVSDTAFLVVDFDVVVFAFVVVVVALDVLVAFAVVTVVVVTAFDDFSVLEVVSAAVVVVWLTAEVTAVGSSFTVFSVVPQAVSMADNIMISIAFFMLSAPFSNTILQSLRRSQVILENFYLLDCLHS